MITRQQRRQNARQLRKIYNSAPYMIHEKLYEQLDCVLCGTKMKTIHHTHNPFPLTKRCYPKEVLETERKDRCCYTCDVEKVIPARMRLDGVDPATAPIEHFDIWVI